MQQFLAPDVGGVDIGVESCLTFKFRQASGGSRSDHIQNEMKNDKWTISATEFVEEVNLDIF